MQDNQSAQPAYHIPKLFNEQYLDMLLVNLII